MCIDFRKKLKIEGNCRSKFKNVAMLLVSANSRERGRENPWYVGYPRAQ
jgi:hypothetical protein